MAMRREGSPGGQAGTPNARGPLPPSVDAPGAAGEELAGLEGFLDGGLVRLAGGSAAEPFGSEGVLVVDFDGLRVAGGELVIRERKPGSGGLQPGEPQDEGVLEASALAARACLLPASASRAASGSASAWARVSSSSVSSFSASWPMAVASSWAAMPSCQREPDRCRVHDGSAARALEHGGCAALLEPDEITATSGEDEKRAMGQYRCRQKA
jgi:hypothetical protein